MSLRNRPISGFIRCVVLVLAISFGAGALAQSDPIDTVPPTENIELVHAQIAAAEMEIDGRLDETIWKSIATVGTFAVVEPDNLAPEKYPTHFRVFYTDKGIYVGVDMVQPRETLVSRLSARDLRQLNRDSVFITFDSSSEGKYGYWFGIALGGSLMDGTILPERRYATDWDGPWLGATAVTEHGWSAEMFLPWSMMSMPHTTGTRAMGVYVSRKVAHLNERWGWPQIPETRPKFMSVLDRVAVENIAPKQQYNVFPYASLTADEVKDDLKFKAGVDLFWRPSTDFQLTTTLNPDFGTVEADDVIVNLTAIETFFPEKRLFFLEGKDVFVATPRANPSGSSGSFPLPNAANSLPTTLFNSRRIGGRAFAPIIPPGVRVPTIELTQPPELLGAFKATGDTRGVRYGVLAAIEDETTFEGMSAVGTPVLLEEEGRNYAVVRAIHESSSDNYKGIGFMSTFTDHPRREAMTHGIDTHFLSRSGKFQWDSQVMMSDINAATPGADQGRGYGAFIDTRYSARKGRNHVFGLDYFDDTININDVGIFRRNDVHGARYIYNIRTSNISFGKDAYFQVLLPHEWNSDWQVVRTGMFLEGFVVRKDLTEWRFNLNAFPARYEDRNSFGNGVFRVEDRGQAAIGFSTDTSRRFSALLDVRTEGEELGGGNFAQQGVIVWRPMDRLTSDLTLYHRNRDGWLLHEGGTSRRMITFDSEEWSVKYGLDFFFNARHHFRMALQWVGIKAFEDEIFQIPATAGDLIPTAKLPGEPTDNFNISTVNFQLRYRWEIAPMSDLFLVYTKNGNQRALPVDDFGSMFSDSYRHPVSEQLVVKLRYRFGS